MISVKGTDRVIMAIRKAGVRYANTMITAVEMAAGDVQTHAQSDHEQGFAHGLGRYENQTLMLTPSITVHGPTVTGTKITAQVSTNMEYAEDVEYGTGGGRRAYPFMEPAYVANQNSITKRFEQLVLANGLR